MKQIEDLAARLGLPVSGWLLDAGGGTGRIAHALKSYSQKIVVVDLSLEMLRQAQVKNGLSITCSHTEKLPFSDHSFDGVVMVDALHHVCDQAETAGELWRVLKPGGRIVIEEPDIRTLTVKILAVMEKVLLMRSHFLAPADIRALFPFPNARVDLAVDGFNAWVIVEKSEL